MRLIDADMLEHDIDKYCHGDGYFKHWVECQPTVIGWISVKDRLPMLVETVLFIGKRYDGGWFGTKRGYFDGTDWYADDEGTIYRTTPVTHWMPLPDPPNI